MKKIPRVIVQSRGHDVEEIPAGLDVTEVATAYSDGNFEWKDLANVLQRYTVDQKSVYV